MSSPMPNPIRETPTRRATLETWQPNGRIKHTLDTWQIAFTGDPTALVRRAAQLVPRLRPLKMCLTMTPEGPFVEIHYGWNAGAQTMVSIRLTAADLPVMLAYAARWSAHIKELIIVWGCDDGDGGEVLPVPRVSGAEFAAMPTPGRVV